MGRQKKSFLHRRSIQNQKKSGRLRRASTVTRFIRKVVFDTRLESCVLRYSLTWCSYWRMSYRNVWVNSAVSVLHGLLSGGTRISEIGLQTPSELGWGWGGGGMIMKMKEIGSSRGMGCICMGCVCLSG